MSEFDFGDASKHAVGVYRFMTSTTGNSKYSFGRTTDQARREVTVVEQGAQAELQPELQALADQLRELARQLKVAGHDAAASKIEAAREPALAGDANSTRGFLIEAGDWALKVSTKIGTSVATAAIKAALGLPA